MSFERDAEIVEWIGRLGAAGVEHVAAHMGLSHTWTFERLKALRKGGLIVRHHILRVRPVLHAATSKGLRWRGLSGLGTCSICAAKFEHSWHASRLVKICNGWARARHVDATYYLATPEAARAVGRAVKKTRSEDCVKILPLEQTSEVIRIEGRAGASEAADDEHHPASAAGEMPPPDTLPPR